MLVSKSTIWAAEWLKYRWCHIQWCKAQCVRFQKLSSEGYAIPPQSLMCLSPILECKVEIILLYGVVPMRDTLAICFDFVKPKVKISN